MPWLLVHRDYAWSFRAFCADLLSVVLTRNQHLVCYPKFSARECIFCVFIGCTIAQAQSPAPGTQYDPMRSYRAFDGDVPAATGVLEEKDSVALNELIGEVLLHRTAIESQASCRNMTPRQRAVLVTDFYFDPTSGLLVTSAGFIRIDSAGNNNSLRVIPYGDYRKVGDSTILYRYTQTLDGQKQWPLQLSDVQLNPALQASFFEPQGDTR